MVFEVADGHSLILENLELGKSQLYELKII
jgi:hypothetical protein